MSVTMYLSMKVGVKQHDGTRQRMTSI